MCLSGCKKSEKPSSGPTAACPADGSPSSCPCTFTITGPSNVPGLSKYKFKIDIPAGKTASSITWSVDKPTAGFEGTTNAVNAVVTFKNTKADWIKLKATFTLDGQQQCAEKQVALVKVEVGPATFNNPGKAAESSSGSKIFLVNPPQSPAAPKWITENDPGSDLNKFVYNGTLQAAEPRKLIQSNGGGGGPAYSAASTVKLTSPAEQPSALQKIQIGFIQHGSDSGSADYGHGLKRTVKTPTSRTVDWYASVPSDEWPWYDSSARDTGSGSGSWSKTLTMDDSPSLSVPAQYNPNKATDPNSTKTLSSATETFAFTIRIAARTLDADLGADKHYFDESNSTWNVDFGWPLIPNTSIVTIGSSWNVPNAPSEVDVNVVPTSINHNSPFLRWEP